MRYMPNKQFDIIINTDDEPFPLRERVIAQDNWHLGTLIAEKLKRMDRQNIGILSIIVLEVK